MRTPITHVRYVGLGVENFSVERAFLQDVWGLAEVAGSDETACFAAKGSDEHHVLRLRKAEQRRTDLFGLAAEDRAGVETLHERLRSKDVKVVSSPRALQTPGGGYGFRFFDPDGRLVEISSEVAKREPAPDVRKSATPQRLSHVVFHTPNLAATVDWYVDMLGLRVSDWLTDFMCFMRGNGSKHHCMAFLAGPPALNHIAFEMSNMDEMMRGLGRMHRNNIELTWGPGRHTAGDNTFCYFRSPAGTILEYTAELESLPEDWTPRALPRRADIIDQWQTGRIMGAPVYPAIVPDAGLWRADMPW